MDMRTDLIAVPHAGLGFHFLRVSVGNQRILGVFKRRNGPKRKKTNEQADDVPLTSAVRRKHQNFEVLGLASCHSERKENGRYVGVANSDITRSNGCLRW